MIPDPEIPEYHVEEDHAPDILGHVLGWREFDLLDSGHLASSNGHWVWEKGENEARCQNSRCGLNNEHLAPQEDCSCGFYAYHGAYAARPRRGRMGAAPRVAALVRGWGKVAVHHTGFRSQYAEVLALIAKPNAPGLKAAKRRYGVPVYVCDPENDSELVAAREKARLHGSLFGDFVPEEMRPEKEEEKDYEAQGFRNIMATSGVQPAALLTTPQMKARYGVALTSKQRAFIYDWTDFEPLPGDWKTDAVWLFVLTLGALSSIVLIYLALGFAGV